MILDEITRVSDSLEEINRKYNDLIDKKLHIKGLAFKATRKEATNIERENAALELVKFCLREL